MLCHFILSLNNIFNRYWWLRIQCLAEEGMWSDLEKFSKSKKSPIGYEVRTNKLTNLR